MDNARKWRARKGAEVMDFGGDNLARILQEDGWEVWEVEDKPAPERRIAHESGVFRIDT